MSHKNFSSSAAYASRLPSLHVGIGALVLSAAAGLAVAEDAQAAEITTVTHDNAMLCFGSSGGGTYRGEQVSVKTVVENGKTTLMVTAKEVSKNSETNGLSPEDYATKTYRDYFYGHRESGWSTYMVDKDPLDGAYFSVVSGLYANFQFGDDLNIVQGTTFDQDRAIITGEGKIDIFAPFKPDGKVKPEFKFTKTPNQPLFSFTPKGDTTAVKMIGNTIYAQEQVKGKYQLTTYLFSGDKITEGAVIPLPGDVVVWTKGRKVEFNCGESPTKKSKHIIVQRKDIDGIMTIDLTDPTKKKEYPGVADMVSSDPEGRYQFRQLNSGKVVLVDGFTGATKEVLSTGIPFQLNGYVTHLPAYKNPTFLILDKEGEGDSKLPPKYYLVEVTNPVTMELKVTGTEASLFTKEYKYSTSTGTGGADCVPNPNLKGISETTGTQPEAVEVAEVAEKVEQDTDAGTSDGDGGSLEVITNDIKDTQNPPDAADGQGDTQDAAEAAEPADITIADVNGDGTPDQSRQPDQITRVDTTKEIPVETSGTDTAASQETSGNKPDAAISTDTANKPDTAPTAKSKPPADGCSTTDRPSEDGLLATGVLIAGVAYAIRRRKEQFHTIER